MTLSDTVALVRSRKASAREVTVATLARIERLDPQLKCYITVAADAAMTDADALDAKQRRGEPLGLLHGVPIAFKDTIETARIRTTYGSPLYAQNVPAEDQLCVERLRVAGAIIIGKTNTPEFAIGAHTWTTFVGACRNPHNTQKTPGGSSGGSAAAAAAGLCAGAVGSDFGGSLRIPASFSGIVAFRTCPGRVPQYPKLSAWDTLNVNGPMTRTVRDAALMLAVMAGPDDRDPTSITEPGDAFLPSPVPLPMRGLRVAWSSDLGSCPVQKSVLQVCQRAAARLEDLSWTVEETHPDISGVAEVWNRLRAFLILHTHRRHVLEHGDRLNPHLVWNVEQYAGLSAFEVGLAEQQRAKLYHRMREFLARYDLLITPAVSVEPWDAGVPFPKEVDGIPVVNYYDWAKLSWTFSVTGFPALSLPCGKTGSGMPVGLQIIGPYRGERRVLAAAQAIEEELALDLRPPAPYGVSAS